MKRKILAVLTALLLVSCMSVSAATIKIEFDAGANGIDVSGTIPETTQGGSDLMLVIKDSDGNYITAASAVSVYSDGNVSYSFDKILMSTELDSGDYTVSVFGKDITSPVTDTFTYTNPKLVYNALKDLTENSASGKDWKDTAASFKANATALGLDTTCYDSIESDEGREAFAAIMQTVNYNLPEDYTKGDEISREIDKAKAMLFNAGAAGTFIDANSATAVKTWYDTYYDKLGFDDGTDAGAVTPIVKSVLGTGTYASRITKAEGTPTIDDIKAYMYENALLAAIENEKALGVLNILQEFESSFFKGIDLDKFNSSLDEIQQGSVLDEMSGTYYDTCDLAVKGFNNLVKEEISRSEEEEDDDDYRGGGGGGGGGRGGSIAIPATPKETKKEAVFTDLSSVAWAEEAINYLYGKGIVNGKTSDTFAPTDMITRAEFVKIIVTALDELADSHDTGFADVSASDWFAPYVLTAKAHGIVTGDGNGCFNPNAPITREDIAVILHRTVEAGTAESELAFGDAGDVSGYAVNAVAYFAENGIINGLGDGNFGPKKNASRAEAAVMLHRLMTILI